MTGTETFALDLMQDYLDFGYTVSEAAELASKQADVTPARILVLAGR